MLIDSFGRTLDYLRVSITDRCNLRCLYCMPPQGVKWTPHESILTFEEILGLTGIMSQLGVKHVKVTGGEPLLRRVVSSFMKNLKTIPGIESVTMTTNGILLGEYLNEDAGQDSLPDGINISLDALNREQYRHITRSEADPKTILLLIESLLEKNIKVKINCVPMRGVNENQIIPITSLAKEKNIIVRFIELMPFGFAGNFAPVPGQETAQMIEMAFGPLSPFNGICGNGPAVYYSLAGFTGKIGFINAVSCGFCETCNRLRLTSRGLLKLCLAEDYGMDLREAIRNGRTDRWLVRAIAEFAAGKPKNHSFCEIPGEATRGKIDFYMSGIGG